MVEKIIKKNSEMFLKYVFTEGERKNLGEDMARKVTEAEDLEDQKKAVVSEFSGKINLARAEANAKAKKLTSGFEMKMIECEETFDYDKQKVIVIRLDDGEIVETRAMTNYELQQKIFNEKEE